MSHRPLALSAVLFVLSMSAAALAQSVRHISPPRAPAPTRDRMEMSTTAFPGLGSPQSPIVIVEFSEFECTYCRRHARTVLPQLLERYVSTGKARYLFAQVPPVEAPGSQIGAIALLCAARSDSVLPMYQWLFEQSDLSESSISAAAAQTGLNAEELQTCMTQPEVREELARHVEIAKQHGVIGTPTFVIGAAHDGRFKAAVTSFGIQPFSYFETAVERLLQQHEPLERRKR